MSAKSDTWDGPDGLALYARMKALWAQGLSTAKISRNLGISKNAVVGKSGRNRADFPGRPDPIHRFTPRKPGSPVKRQIAPKAVPLAPKAPTLSPMSSQAERADLQRWQDSLADRIAGIWAKSPAPRPAADAFTFPHFGIAPVPKPAPPERPRSACCFPSGVKPILFECTELAVSGKPYCLAHNQLAHVTTRSRNTEQEEIHGEKV